MLMYAITPLGSSLRKLVYSASSSGVVAKACRYVHYAVSVMSFSAGMPETTVWSFWLMDRSFVLEP